MFYSSTEIVQPNLIILMNYTRVNSSEELEVYEEVGRGGFGVVYRGIIKSTNQEVAIKQIDLEKI